MAFFTVFKPFSTFSFHFFHFIFLHASQSLSWRRACLRTCARIPRALGSCAVSSLIPCACRRWLQILQRNLLHLARIKTSRDTSMQSLKSEHLLIQNLLDILSSPFKKTTRKLEWSVSTQKTRMSSNEGSNTNFQLASLASAHRKKDTVMV